MSSTMYTSKTRAQNEPKTFTSKLIGKETSSLEESLRSMKVDEGKCEDETGVSSLSSAFYFTMKVLGTTFATNATIPRVRIMP